MNFVKHARVPRDMQYKYLIIVYTIPSTCFVPGMEEEDRCICLAHIDISFKIKSDFIDSILQILRKKNFFKEAFTFFMSSSVLCMISYFYYLCP